MLDFLVLGLIPGTHIQITFTGIAYVFSLALLGTLLYIDRENIKQYQQTVAARLRKKETTQA